jgi:hypothetical protein
MGMAKLESTEHTDHGLHIETAAGDKIYNEV